MSPLDDGIDHRPLADLYVEFWKWRNKQGLPHIPAEELVNEDVTPEQRRYLAVFIEQEEAILARKPSVPATVFRLDRLEVAFARLFRDAGMDCAAHKAKKAIKKAVFSLARNALVAPSNGREEHDELNAIADDAETLVERLNRVGDMGIDDRSQWDCTLEKTAGRYHAVRLGFCMSARLNAFWGEERATDAKRLSGFAKPLHSQTGSSMAHNALFDVP
jgi:hypothetical protein